MKKIVARALIFLHLLYVAGFPLSGITVPNTFSSGAKIYASEINANNDSLETFTTRAADTVNAITTGTKLFSKIIVDTIRSNPDVDSIKGNPFIDTVTTNGLVVGGGDFLGKIVVDTGHTGTGTSKASIPFPAGLTDSTCVVLSYAVRVADVSWESNPGLLGMVSLVTATHNYAIYYPDVSTYHAMKYRVVFMKVSK